MFLEILLFLIGIGLIFKGSDYFVDASVAIGERARLPRLVIGCTIVSIATTSPELTVSIISGVNRVPGLAVGNALGSVAANIGFILALAAIIKPFKLPQGKFQQRALIIIGLTLLLFLFTIDLNVPRWRGFILVIIGIIYLILDFRRGKKQYAAENNNLSGSTTSKFNSRRAIIFYFILGLAMVIGGSNLLVNAASNIAEVLGIPSLFVGLTIVAIGTSLPELATAIAAVRKNVFDLSVGNLIGANILNLTLVTGTAASISPLTLSRMNQLFTFPMVVAILSVFFFSARSNNEMTRKEGIILLACYICLITGSIILNAG